MDDIDLYYQYLYVWIWSSFFVWAAALDFLEWSLCDDGFFSLFFLCGYFCLFFNMLFINKCFLVKIDSFVDDLICFFSALEPFNKYLLIF